MLLVKIWIVNIAGSQEGFWIGLSGNNRCLNCHSVDYYNERVWNGDTMAERWDLELED